ncbi:MAG: PAC2 family protein [Bifidobacteriaceae bacterium]|jgi:predicted ATP-grasp superfamily ATP-dependent carboligase|nr:PAC2 family protein [Bifidobacteriaceae bacterium]
MRYEESPEDMIIVFDGFNDPGRGAAIAVEYLLENCPHMKIAEIDGDDYLDLRYDRPEVVLDEDGERRIKWPQTAIYVAYLDNLKAGSSKPAPVFIVHGFEPMFKWKEYTKEILSEAYFYDIKRVITMGSMLSDVPHTRQMNVTETANGIGDPFDEKYEGITGILGAFAYSAYKRGYTTKSLWVTAPHYLPKAPSPKSALALIHKLEEVLNITIPTTDLLDFVEKWEDDVDELIEESGEIAEYVEKLETEKDKQDLKDATADSIALEFERYLRHYQEKRPSNEHKE